MLSVENQKSFFLSILRWKKETQQMHERVTLIHILDLFIAKGNADNYKKDIRLRQYQGYQGYQRN